MLFLDILRSGRYSEYRRMGARAYLYGSNFADAAGVFAQQNQSVHANLQYLAAPRLMLGGELMFASKEREDGGDSDMSRLQ